MEWLWVPELLHDVGEKVSLMLENIAYLSFIQENQTFLQLKTQAFLVSFRVSPAFRNPSLAWACKQTSPRELGSPSADEFTAALRQRGRWRTAAVYPGTSSWSRRDHLCDVFAQDFFFLPTFWLVLRHFGRILPFRNSLRISRHLQVLIKGDYNTFPTPSGAQRWGL